LNNCFNFLLIFFCVRDKTSGKRHFLTIINYFPLRHVTKVLGAFNFSAFPLSPFPPANRPPARFIAFFLR
jgi:hypothetical protein